MSRDGETISCGAEATSSGSRPNVSEELAKLKFEKRNQSLRRLPPNAIIQRRPLNHAPVASPYAGASVQKVVYVSRKTPVMSAVKRVKKLLSHIEKRAMQGVDLTKDKKNGMKKLAVASEKLEKSGEEVLVKASGRAMDQALRVGEWFRTREDELTCKVEVRTGSVQAIDDIVEKEVDEDQHTSDQIGDDSEIPLEISDLEHDDSTLHSSDKDRPSRNDQIPLGQQGDEQQQKEGSQPKQGQRRKRKREFYDKDDLPEARIRYVKTIEVAISLKG